MFAYDIDESKQAGDGFAAGPELEGFEVDPYTVSFAAPSFDQAVADMQRQGTQIIFDAMDDGANRKLCDAMARRQFKVKAKVSTVVSMGDSVGNDYNDTCRNCVYIPGDSIPYTRHQRPGRRRVPRRPSPSTSPARSSTSGRSRRGPRATMVADGVRRMGPAPTRKGLEDFLRRPAEVHRPTAC